MIKSRWRYFWLLVFAVMFGHASVGEAATKPATSFSHQSPQCVGVACWNFSFHSPARFTHKELKCW